MTSAVVSKELTKIEVLNQIVECLQNNCSLFANDTDFYARGYRDAIDDAINVIRDAYGLEPMEDEEF